MRADYYPSCSLRNHGSCLSGYNAISSLLDMTLAKRIKQERTALGLSQKALSAEAGISQQMVGKLELGTTEETSKLVQLAAALNVSADWLATGRGPKERSANPVDTARASEKHTATPSPGAKADKGAPAPLAWMTSSPAHARLAKTLAHSGGQLSPQSAGAIETLVNELASCDARQVKDDRTITGFKGKAKRDDPAPSR